MTKVLENRWGKGSEEYHKFDDANHNNWGGVEADLEIAKIETEKSEDDFTFFNEEKAKRPKWKDVYEGYPKTSNSLDDMPASDLFSILLGINYDSDIFSNACATRVSLGLINAGNEVRKDFVIQQGKYKGKGFIASAINLKNWLSLPSVFGEADEILEAPDNLTNVASTLCQRNGIYIIIGGFGGGVSGHATLWIGKNMNVIGEHNYIDPARTIYFWELL
jgi:hypothetical protein